MNGANSQTFIPRRPLLWLATALLFTVPPMFDALPVWVPVVFLGSLLAKFWMEKKVTHLRSIALKGAGAAIGFVGVALSHGSLKGSEPAMSALLVLTSFKMLEAHTARDFHILVMTGWFLCLCGFFIAQDLTTALHVFVAFGLLLAAMIQFHRGAGSRGALWPPLRTAGGLLLQALPLVLLMFLLFPRISGGFRFYLTRTIAQSSGFSDRISPGSVTSIALSQAPAFRVEFPDGNMPAPAAMYWRGSVMWTCGDGMSWHGGTLAIIPSSAPRTGGQAVRQLITIEPHGDRWMFALDWPAKAPTGAVIEPGSYLRSVRRITSSRRYEVTSLRTLRGAELQSGEERASLQLPPTISPAVRALAQSWTRQQTEPRAIVQSALQFFQKNGFRYSLSPGDYRQEALDEFLFRRRVGFCEHYAASFATLMRAAGVPARVVVGYLGGQFNNLGNYLLVRQAEAHAWCEVWLPGSGWTRVDPTSVVAPERVNLGFDSFMEMRETAGGPVVDASRIGVAQMSTRRRVLNNARLAWDTVNYAWNTRVLSFDADAQQALFEQTDLGDSTAVTLLVRLFVAAGCIVGLYALWMWLKTRAKDDPVKTLYERFCRAAAKSGATRDPFEGPADFGERAARLLPNEAERIRRLTDIYISLRYAPEPSASLLECFAEEVKAFAPRRPTN